MLAKNIKSEFVIGITGIVNARDEKDINPEMKTGKIEILAQDLIIFSES